MAKLTDEEIRKIEEWINDPNVCIQEVAYCHLKTLIAALRADRRAKMRLAERMYEIGGNCPADAFETYSSLNRCSDVCTPDSGPKCWAEWPEEENDADKSTD